MYVLHHRADKDGGIAPLDLSTLLLVALVSRFQRLPSMQSIG